MGGVKETIRLSNVARNNVYHWYKLSTHTADEMDLSRKGILVAHRRYILIISLKRAIGNTIHVVHSLRISKKILRK